ncbi:EthD family reductase [Massilia oculi]|uniref:EthD family reductase n=1 Tax=Massilia oculi TaxID=945844 RepID=UPI001AAFF118|nr:EthD family reductase [Massilia oculi]
MNIDSQVVVYVSYQGTPSTRFDRDYYVTHHLPLCMEAWNKYGLQRVSAYFPELLQEQAGTIAICECVFRDEAAMDASFSSPELPDVMADLPFFTDVLPVRLRGVAL